MTPPQPHGNWVVRRRLMFCIVGFCMAAVAWTLYSGRIDKVAETVVTMGFTIMGTTIGTYIGGAALEKRK